MKTKITVLAALALLTLTGCTNPGKNAFYQDLPDGTQVLCVWVEGYNSGGLTCDWNNKLSKTGKE